MKRRRLFLVTLMMVFFVLSGNAFMAFCGSGPMRDIYPNYPEELKALFNDEARIVGAIGPINECSGYYAGDTTQLNTFLKAYAKVPDTRLQIILHAGHRLFNMRQVDQNDETDKMVNVDWVLSCWTPRHDTKPEDFQGKKIYSRLEIWLGGQIDLNKLEVPATLEMHSGGEIEGYIQKHVERQKPQNKDK